MSAVTRTVTRKRALAASFVVTTSTALLACQPATEPQSAPVPEPHRNPPDPGPNPVATAPATSASATSASASPSGQVPPRALPVASAPHAMPVPDPPHAVNPAGSSPPPVMATPPDAPPANGKMCDASGARPCIQKSPDGTCTLLPVVTRCPQGVKCNPPPPRRVACPLAVAVSLSSEPQLRALSAEAVRAPRGAAKSL